MSIALVTIERRDGDEDVRSDGEGRFTITAPNAFRFRVTAHGEERTFTSGMLRGPADDVEVKEVEWRRDVRRITVRCVDAATKATIEDFHASLGGGLLTDNTLEAVLNHPEQRQPFRGEATFDVSAQQREHCMRVVAGVFVDREDLERDVQAPQMLRGPAHGNADEFLVVPERQDDGNVEPRRV